MNRQADYGHENVDELMVDIKAWVIDTQKEAVTSIYDLAQISEYPKSVIEILSKQRFRAL
ncbi:MAG: hypothetical protein VB082_06135 [Christensenella sp.]|nr:hypothetical protein [Christensenella sp.]